MLSAANFSLPFSLAVDAGDLLLQQENNGLGHHVCLFSCKINCRQPVYLTVKKEVFALVLALHHAEVYFGNAAQPVTVYTGHNRAGVGPLFSPGISGPRPAYFFHGSGNWINEATVQLLISCSFF